MSRYIDTKWLEDNAKEYSLGYYEEDEWATPLNVLDSAPSIDIVRCGECKNYLLRQKNLPYAVRKRYCNKGAIKATSPDDFCSYGERSE